MNAVRFPQMRNDLVGAIHALADPDYQRRVWLRREYPHVGYFDDLTLNINVLYDDTRVLENPHQAIGDILQSRSEAMAMERLAQALEAMFDRLGTEMSDEEYLNAPEWPSVVEAARATLAELEGFRD